MSQTAADNRRWTARVMVAVLVAFWLLLFVATHVPLSLPAGGGSNRDKLAHFWAYFLLAVLFSAALAARTRIGWRHLLLVFVIAVAYGVFDELLQIPIPDRSAEVYDWISDCLGAAAGVVTFGAIYTWWQRK